MSFKPPAMTEGNTVYVPNAPLEQQSTPPASISIPPADVLPPQHERLLTGWRSADIGAQIAAIPEFETKLPRYEGRRTSTASEGEFAKGRGNMGVSVRPKTPETEVGMVKVGEAVDVDGEACGGDDDDDDGDADDEDDEDEEEE